MNKDFEKEYKKLMTEDVPDLWGRIEAGLEPKETAVKKVNFWKKYRVWGTLAAACLCLALILPALFEERSIEERGRHNGGGNPNSASIGGNEPLDKNLAGFGQDSTENFGPQENCAAENGGSANSSEQEPTRETDEDINGFFTVTGKVIEVFEEEDENEFLEKVFLVQIAETDCDNLVEGDTVRLYGWRDLGDRLLKGETYRFYILVTQLNGDEDGYYIYDYKSQ